MAPSEAERDAFQGLRALSARLRAPLPELLVDRRGAGAEAHMRTENIVGQVLPRAAYEVVPGGLRPAAAATM